MRKRRIIYVFSLLEFISNIDLSSCYVLSHFIPLLRLLVITYWVASLNIVIWYSHFLLELFMALWLSCMLWYILGILPSVSCLCSMFNYKEQFHFIHFSSLDVHYEDFFLGHWIIEVGQSNHLLAVSFLMMPLFTNLFLRGIKKDHNYRFIF